MMQNNRISVILIRIVFIAALLLILNSLKSDSLVAAEQPDDDIYSMSVSNDTYSDSQWYLANPGYYTSYAFDESQQISAGGGIDMNVPKAWESMKKTGLAEHEVVVAVIDTGIDSTHPDLSQSIWVNHGEIPGDGIDNDHNGYIDDVNGWDFYNNDASICHYEYDGKHKSVSKEDKDNHGTHIAGIIAAAGGNNTGIAGVASNINIKIMTLKINGGSDSSGKMSDAIKAIRYASMMGADICNISWGTTTYSSGMKQAMKESDMLFVAAAGNTGTNNDKEPVYPADFKLDNLISVTSIDSQGELNYYSNYGADTVDLAAPGDDIYSTVIGGYASMSGSSMAAPQVTSIAAMLYAGRNHIYASNVKDIITGNIKPLPKLKGKMRYAGIPDAYRIVEAAEKLIQDTSPPVLSLKTIYNKKIITVPVYAKDFGNSKIRLIKWIFGKKTAEDFMHGVNGTLVKDHVVNLKDAGFYTFYASDYAGNETVRTYKVIPDTKAPDLSLSYTVSKNNRISTVTVMAGDSQSGINRIEYMSGKKSAEDFLPAGDGTPVAYKNGKGTFIVKQEGIYTVFVSDNRGNRNVKTVMIRMVKRTEPQLLADRNTGLADDRKHLSDCTGKSGIAGRPSTGCRITLNSDA